MFPPPLDRCRMLNLHHNHLVCLRQLPKLPAVEHLCLSENAINSLGGLGALGNSPLRSLNMTRNPVTFTQDYRARYSNSKGQMCIKGSCKILKNRRDCVRETQILTHFISFVISMFLSVQCFFLFAKAGGPRWNPEAATRHIAHQTTVPRNHQDVQHFVRWFYGCFVY